MYKIDSLKVKNQIKELRENSEIDSLIKEIETYGELFLIGGAIKSLALCKEPNDWDFILNCSEDVHLKEMISKRSFQCNRYGGLKFRISNLTLDIWDINSHWAFKQKLLVKDFEQIKTTLFFSTDSGLYSLKTNKLKDEELKKSFESKRIELLLNRNWLDYVDLDSNIYRAFCLKKETNFDFSEELEEIINEWFKKEYDPLMKLKEIEKYKNREGTIHYFDLKRYLF